MMFETVLEKAYAKINFGLKVLPKREDGFHNIESIFQTIDLYDELIVSWNEKKECKVHCEFMDLPAENTLTKAYKAFVEIAGVEVPGVNVELKKGIPSGGGLGGGSSDAAALIRVLENICGISLSNLQLDYVASKTGSDVFFFMHGDKNGRSCALVSGRGEIVKEIAPRKDLILLLIFPKVSSSTKEAYSLVDEAYNRGEEVEGPDFSELEFVYNKSVQNWSFKNTFTPVISKVYPEIGKAIGELEKLGCCYAEMSGSGSTVFGVFTLIQQAEFACNLLAATWDCKLVRTI
ncbi:MAG: 4-(cytidine 5'-diphospho)-2-C-methyl-D-erythritol kinase [Treponema sp.]|nr:4-(cytidine 5'-diphospho)-2-C-methyl-D-erythritol kinase [Spirochaetia bacterium]MDY2839424.1 4-(cytidine 5'-diphospho)-2-C-methyl-D-erythritol kinase [Treponema sp.]